MVGAGAGGGSSDELPEDMPFMGALSMMNGPSPAERAQAKRQQRNLVSGLEQQLREKKIRELRERERKLRENLSSVEEKVRQRRDMWGNPIEKGSLAYKSLVKSVGKARKEIHKTAKQLRTLGVEPAEEDGASMGTPSVRFGARDDGGDALSIEVANVAQGYASLTPVKSEGPAQVSFGGSMVRADDEEEARRVGFAPGGGIDMGMPQSPRVAVGGGGGGGGVAGGGGGNVFDAINDLKKVCVELGKGQAELREAIRRRNEQSRQQSRGRSGRSARGWSRSRGSRSSPRKISRGGGLGGGGGGGGGEAAYLPNYMRPLISRADPIRDGRLREIRMRKGPKPFVSSPHRR